MTSAAPLLEISGVSKAFGAHRTLRDVSFTIARREVVALVGESGSGKTTLANVLVGLDAADAGTIRFAGATAPTRRQPAALAAYRRDVQMVFQDPYASLNGANTIRYHLTRALAHRRGLARRERDAELRPLLGAVGLGGSSELLDRYPHELSGGQRQRIAIARAIAPQPSLLIADEPTSMLDVSLRTGILRLFARLRDERDLALLLITHDLASARFIADRIVVLYGGEVMEVGGAAEVIDRPQHPYTRLLLAATPHGDARRQPVLPVAGTTALDHREARSVGCAFALRCPLARTVCVDRRPDAVALGHDHDVHCHLHVRPDPA